MGGSKGDRKSYKGTSAAKAAEALAAKGVGAGFGGYAGQQVAAADSHQYKPTQQQCTSYEPVRCLATVSVSDRLPFALYRFSGAQPVAGFGFGAPAATSHAASDPVESAAQLDSELAQCLRHLSKRDTTTKLKALQVRSLAVCGEAS